MILHVIDSNFSKVNAWPKKCPSDFTQIGWRYCFKQKLPLFFISFLLAEVKKAGENRETISYWDKGVYLRSLKTNVCIAVEEEDRSILISARIPTSEYCKQANHKGWSMLSAYLLRAEKFLRLLPGLHYEVIW